MKFYMQQAALSIKVREMGWCIRKRHLMTGSPFTPPQEHLPEQPESTALKTHKG